MADQFSTVIVFGATGDVGSATALEASKRGAKVWLAMRNPDKAIDGITKEQELQGDFERIQADLTDPESIKKAVRQSGAKAAFIYHAFGMNDAVQALKEAGIEYVVFLSSFSIGPGQDLRQIPPSELIPYVHAQVEIALEDAGMAHTALRPAYFATNGIRMNLDKSVKPYKARDVAPDLRADCITPNDIGRVGGAVLVKRPSSASKEFIYLCGPQLLTSDEQWDILNKVLGQNVEVVHERPEDHRGFLISKGLPPPLADYLISSTTGATVANWYPDNLLGEWVANIKKYSGYEPTTFEEFAKTQNLA